MADRFPMGVAMVTAHLALGAAACARQPSDSAPSASHASSLGPAPASATPSAPAADFTREAKMLFRIAACGRSYGGASQADEEAERGEPPEGTGGATDGLRSSFDAAVVARHCDELEHLYREYRLSWVDPAKTFFALQRPAGLPTVVVYPFGGGDLASALAVFPDATEVTTISLEPAGDVRAVDAIPPDRLAGELSAHRSRIGSLFQGAYSRTDSLRTGSSASLPGEMLFTLAALVIHDEEPVSLHYFRLSSDGDIVYLTQADIERASSDASLLAHLFDNAELRFRSCGRPAAPIQVLRHIAYDLDDEHLEADPALLAYLSRKGHVAAMTKAASHLLWRDDFSVIRQWLLDHATWMVADSTGFPPAIAARAGFSQETFGRYEGPGPWGSPVPAIAADVELLFASQPPRPLGFRFGYPDRFGHTNLTIWRR